MSNHFFRIGLVSSNKSWANFSNRSDSNYTRDNCCIFDVYTTSSQQIQYSEFGRAFKCHPISLPTTLLTRQHLQSTGDPNVLFVLSIPVPIDLPTDRLSRGSDSRRAIKSSTWSEILGPSFNVTKRSVFLFLFFFTGETQVGNAPSLRFFVGERRDNLSLFLCRFYSLNGKSWNRRREGRKVPYSPRDTPSNQEPISRGNYCVWATWTRISLPYIPRDIMGWKEVKRGWSFSWNSLSQKGASVAPLLPSSFFPFQFFSFFRKDILRFVSALTFSHPCFFFWKTRVQKGNLNGTKTSFSRTSVLSRTFRESKKEENADWM